MPELKRLEVIDSERCVGCQLCMFACNRRFGSGGLAKSAIRVRSSGGIERGFVVIVCRACNDPPCLRTCPVDALKLRDGGGVILDSTICIGCGRCAEACPMELYYGILRIINQISVSTVDIVSDIVHMKYLH